MGPNTLHPFIINTDPVIITDGTTDLDYACGQCHGGGTNSVDNPPKTGIPYRTKAVLATVAEGMHASAGVSYPVTFTTSVTPNTLTVNVIASVDCGTCPPLTYDWNWGDGTPNGPATGASASHTYTTAGTKSIILTVSVEAGTTGSVIRIVTIANPDLPPAAGAACVWNANTWTMDLTDTSTDDGPDGDADNDVSPLLTTSVDWGDASAKSYGSAGTAFSHVYTKTTGAFTVSLKAVDSKLQSSTFSCVPVTPAYFTISGTVKKSVSAGGANLASAVVHLQQTAGGSYSGTLMTGTGTPIALGTFSFGSLKPGTYKIKAKKSGYTFPAEATIVVGPSSAGNTIQALTP